MTPPAIAFEARTDGVLVVKIEVSGLAGAFANGFFEELERAAPPESPVETGRVLGRRNDRKVVEKRLASERHERLGRAREIVADFVVVPDHIDGHCFQKSAQRLRTPLIAVARAIFEERRSLKVRSRLIRWRRTGIVAVNRIAEEQKEVEVLFLHHVEDRIATRPPAAALLTSQIPAPGEHDRDR